MLAQCIMHREHRHIGLNYITFVHCHTRRAFVLCGSVARRFAVYCSLQSDNGFDKYTRYGHGHFYRGSFFYLSCVDRQFSPLLSLSFDVAGRLLPPACPSQPPLLAG